MVVTHFLFVLSIRLISTREAYIKNVKFHGIAQTCPNISSYHLLFIFTFQFSFKFGWFIFNNSSILLVARIILNGCLLNTFSDTYIAKMSIFFFLKSYICYSNLWHHHKLPHTCLRLFPSTIICIFPVYRWIHSTIRYMIRYRAIIQKLYICIFTSKGMVQTYKSYKIVNKISPLFNYSKHLLPHKKTLRGSIDILTY